MKYDEATKLIQGLSKEYSVNNDDKSVFELSYKYKPISWVDKQEQFNFGHMNTLVPEFNKLPYSHKLYMILAELAMTPLNERKEHKWNVIVGNDDGSGHKSIVAWENTYYGYGLYLEDPDGLTCDNAIFTDDEFSALIKHIKTLPDGEWQAKVAEHGKTLVKGE